MEMIALKRECGLRFLLATFSLALALWSTSCGGGGGSVVVPVSTAGFSISSTTVTFSSQAVGTTSAAQSATLDNVGNATLTFSSIQLTGPNSADFNLTNTCGSSLAPSAECTLSVTFTPSAAGTRTASVVFTDNATGSPQTVNLSGTGTSAGVGLSTSILNFGSQSVGTSTAVQTVTLTNNGNAALSVTSIVVTGTNPGDFPQQNTCGTSVAAGGTCVITVSFDPVAVGSRSAVVTITDAAPGSPQLVTLTGTGTNPTVSLSSTSLAFGNQNLGTTSSAQSVMLTNTGNTSLTVSGVSVMGADFTATNTCSGSVVPGGNCSISVTFTPSAAGSRGASVLISDNAIGSPQSITLSGTGVGTAGVAGLSASSVTFGSQSQTISSGPVAITLNNTGNTTLNIASITFGGANPGAFTLSGNTCGSSLAAGGTCTLSVTFTPPSAGTFNATLIVTDDSGGVAGNTQTISLSGTGTTSQISLSAISLTFPTQTVGTTSTAQMVTVNNTGTGSVSIAGVSLTGANPGDFAQSNNCGNSLAAAASCTISLTFTPTSPGARTAGLSISDSASGSPQTVSLAGTGGGASLSLTATSLTFGAQTLGTTSAAQPVTLSNTGTAAMSITSVAVSGTNAGDFSQTNTCPSSLPAGGNCNVSVTFAPTAIGSRSASVTITDNAPGSPQAISLSGTGSGPVVQVSPSTLTFGGTSVGSTSGIQSLTLTNSGNASFDAEWHRFYRRQLRRLCRDLDVPQFGSGECELHD